MVVVDDDNEDADVESPPFGTGIRDMNGTEGKERREV